MKKILFSAAIAIFFFSATSAQTFFIDASVPATASAKILTMAEAHKAAFKNFARIYKGNAVTDADELTDRGLLIRFADSRGRYKAYFSKGGAWTFTVVSYDEKGLPTDVRKEVRSIYYDYQITYVDEVRMPMADPIYRVQLTNGQRTLIVQVNEGELRVVKELVN